MRHLAPAWRDWINEERITAVGSLSIENPCNNKHDENFN